MAKCIMLIGLPAAGKSTWSKKYIECNPDTILVSSDAIREEVFGDINDQSHNGKSLISFISVLLPQSKIIRKLFLILRVFLAREELAS